MHIIMNKISKNDYRYKLLEDIKPIFINKDELKVHLFKNKGKEYLATLCKYIKENKIEYCYFYDLEPRKHYYDKFNKFISNFKNSNETITEYDVVSNDEIEEYLSYIERRYYSNWCKWRHSLNRRQGIRCFDNKNPFTYAHCAYNYLDESYNCPVKFILSFYSPISTNRFNPFLR